MNKCTECGHCKMDDVWGDYKCLAREIYIYSMEKYADCGLFKPKEKKEEEK